MAEFVGDRVVAGSVSATDQQVWVGVEVVRRTVAFAALVDDKAPPATNFARKLAGFSTVGSLERMVVS